MSKESEINPIATAAVTEKNKDTIRAIDAPPPANLAALPVYTKEDRESTRSKNPGFDKMNWFQQQRALAYDQWTKDSNFAYDDPEAFFDGLMNNPEIERINKREQAFHQSLRDAYSRDISTIDDAEAQALYMNIVESDPRFGYSDDYDGTKLFGAEAGTGRENLKRLLDIYTGVNPNGLYSREAQDWMKASDAQKYFYNKRERSIGRAALQIFDTPEEQIKWKENEIMQKQDAVQFASLMATMSPLSQQYVLESLKNGKLDERSAMLLPTEELELATAAYHAAAPYTDAHWWLTQGGLQAWDVTKSSVRGTWRMLANTYNTTGNRMSQHQIDIYEKEQLRQLMLEDAMRYKFNKDELTGLGSIAAGLLGTTPYMLAMSNPYTGTVAAMGMMNDARERMVLSGVDPEKAFWISVPVGVAMTYIEKIQWDKYMGTGLSDLALRQLSVKSLFNALKRIDFRSAAEILKNEAKETAITYLTETSEEVLQQIVEDVGVQLGKGEFDARELVESAYETFIESSPTTFGFGLMRGTGVGPMLRRKFSRMSSLSTDWKEYSQALNEAKNILVEHEKRKMGVGVTTDPTVGATPAAEGKDNAGGESAAKPTEQTAPSAEDLANKRDEAMEHLREMWYGEKSSKARYRKLLDYGLTADQAAALDEFFKLDEAFSEDNPIYTELTGMTYHGSTKQVGADFEMLPKFMRSVKSVKKNDDGSFDVEMEISPGVTVNISMGYKTREEMAELDNNRIIEQVKAKFDKENGKGSWDKLDDVWKSFFIQQSTPNGVTIGRNNIKIDGHDMSYDAIVYLAKKDNKSGDKGANAFHMSHEMFHAATLIAKNRGIISTEDAQKLARVFGKSPRAGEVFDEEEAADAYARWLLGNYTDHTGVFGKIADFFGKILRVLFGENRRLSQENVFRLIERGDLKGVSALSGIEVAKPARVNAGVDGGSKEAKANAEPKAEAKDETKAEAKAQDDKASKPAETKTAPSSHRITVSMNIPGVGKVWTSVEDFEVEDLILPGEDGYDAILAKFENVTNADTYDGHPLVAGGGNVVIGARRVEEARENGDKTIKVKRIRKIETRFSIETALEKLDNTLAAMAQGLEAPNGVQKNSGTFYPDAAEEARLVDKTGFSINPNLRADIDAALNTDRSVGKVEKGGVRVNFCDAPPLFRAIGISEGKVYSKVYILRKIAKDHNLTSEQIASAPNLLEYPAAVFDDNGEGYIFLTEAEAIDEDGRLAPVMFYLREDSEGNFIASAYARKEKAESKYVNLVNAGKVLYYDKNKVTRLPLRGEAQSSLNTFNAGDNVITPERVTGSNISKFSDSVNGDTRFSIAAQREYDEVVSRYTNEDGTKKPGWMKAPNGKPTNLTERQWIQVRTPSFKKWFGDWETVAIKQEWISVRNPEEIKNLQAQDVSHFQPIKDKTEMIDLFKAFGEVKNASDGRVVRFPSKSAGKMIFKKNYASAFKMLFESSLQAFVENEAKYDGHKQHPNVKAYRHYVNKFTDGIGTYYIRFTVRDDSNGSLVHGAEISDIEIYNENRATQFGNQTDGKPILNNGNKPFVDNKIAYYLSEVNPSTVSKVVDENGEPRVVYHGSRWNPLDEAPGDAVFGKSKTPSQGTYLTDRQGFFFANKAVAEDYQGGSLGTLTAYFINARNPYIVDVREELRELEYDIETEREEAEAAGYPIGRWLGEGNVSFEANDSATAYLDDNMHDIIDRADESESDAVLVRGVDGSFVTVIFSPNQIKSATDNNGAFDNTNPDIRFSLAAQREYDEVVSRYTNEDGTKKPGWMKAPNGKPTNLTERQWIQVRTPSFKKWFGDWEMNSEINSFHSRVKDWMNEDNVKWARGKTRDEIFNRFGNELKPIAFIPEGYLRYLSEDILDNRVYSGMGYMIDHAVNHHPEISPEDYSDLQDVIDNADDVKIDDRNKNRNRSLLFIKKIEKVGVVIVSFNESMNGKIVLHKSFFNKMKEGRFDNLPSVNLSSEVGNSSISHTAEAVPAVRLSALEDKSNIPHFVKRVNPATVSKVVDENGEPLVAYHGSNSIFTEFETEGTPGTKTQGTGAFFTNKRKVAVGYSSSVDNVSKSDFDELEEWGEAYGGGVYPVFLNIKKPLSIECNDNNWDDIYGERWQVFNENDEVVFSSGFEYECQEYCNKHEDGSLRIEENKWTTSTDDVIRNEVRNTELDGAIFKDIVDNNDNSVASSDVYVILNPNQVKSATDNNGAFDNTNPDIRFSLAAQREYDDVVSRFTKADGTKKPGWMKAPNGKPTNLTERQWVQVRTPSFKRWFGDWEAMAEIISFDLNAAKEKLQDLIHRQEEVLTTDGVKLLFRGQAKKAWSKEAERESDNSAAHWAAVGNIDELCRRAVQLWEEKPRNGSTDIRAYVKYGAVFTFGGERYIAKITTKAYPEQESQNFYSVESVAVEKIIAHGIHKTITKGQSLDVSDENRISNLIDSVKSASKVVDENGEPRVVYHGTNGYESMRVWDERTKQHNTSYGSFAIFKRTVDGLHNAGHFFSSDESNAGGYGSTLYATYLNIKNPLTIDCGGAGYSVIRHNGEVHDTYEWSEIAERGGYDGVVFNNIRDGVDYGAMQNTTDEYVAFRSNQVKSATDNTGAFDSTNPDIRFSIGGVYTGSAADYEKPSLHYVGTGEGAQVYGWGLYGSTVRGVAEGYAKKSVDTEPLLDGSPFSNTGTRIYLALKTAGSVDGAIALLNGEPDGLRYAKWIEDNRNRISISGPSGNLYEQTFFTNRAPGDESHLLNWYEPVSEEQFGWIKKALKKEGVSISETKLSSGAHGLIFENEKTWRKGYTGAKAKDETVLAADVYTALKELFGSPKAASEFLARAGIDGVKYPVDSYGKTVKDGDEAGWNYVSFRDDNIRVDHKWTDGEQRFSIRTRAYNPEAQVAVVDGTAEPDLKNLTTAEIRSYIRDRYMGREITIDSDGTLVEFTGENLNAAMKKRGKHRRVFHALDALVKNAHYTRFEPNDGQAKHAHLIGQFVYTAAIRLRDGVFGVELKLDIPKTDPEKTRFKGQTLKTKIADAVLSVGPHFEKPLPTSDYETSAAETVRLGDIVSTPQIISQNGGDAQARFSLVTDKNSRRPVSDAAKKDFEKKLGALPGKKKSLGKTKTNYSISLRGDPADLIAAIVANGKRTGKPIDEATVGRLLKGIGGNPNDAKNVMATAASLADATNGRLKGLLDTKAVTDDQFLRIATDAAKQKRLLKMAERVGVYGYKLGREDERRAQELMDAKDKIAQDLIAAAEGFKADEMEAKYGFDIVGTVANAARAEKVKPDKIEDPQDKPGEINGEGVSLMEEEGEADTAEGNAPQEVEAPESEQMKAFKAKAQKRADEIDVQYGLASGTSPAQARANKEQELLNALGEKGGAAEKIADNAKDGESDAFTVKREKLDFNRASDFVAFIETIVEAELKSRGKLAEDEEPFTTPVNIRELVNTARHWLKKIAMNLCSSRGRELILEDIRSMERATTLQGAECAIMNCYARIKEKLITETQRQLVKKLKKEGRKLAEDGKRFKRGGDERERKVRAEVEYWWRNIKRYFEMDAEAIQAELDELNKILEKREETIEAESGYKKENDREWVRANDLKNALIQFGGLINMKPAMIEQISEDILNQLRGSREELENAREDKRIEMQSISMRLQAAMKNPIAEKENRKPAPKWAARMFDSMIGVLHVRLRDLIRFSKGKVRAAAEADLQNIEDAIALASQGYNVYVIQQQDALAQFMEQHYGSPAEGVRRLTEVLDDEDRKLLTKQGVGEMTRSWLMQRYVELLQTDDYAVNIEINKRNGKWREDFDRIFKKYISSDDMKLIAWFRDWYRSNLDEINNEVLIPVSGIKQYSPSENYFPVKMKTKERQGFGAAAKTWSPYPNWLTPRVANSLDFDESTDILTLWYKRMRESGVSIHYAKLGVNLGEIFMTPEMKKCIADNHGDVALKRLKEHFMDIVGGGAKDIINSDSSLEFADRLRAWQTNLTLAWNFISAFKQMFSTPVFALRHDINLGMVNKFMREIDLGSIRELMASDGWKSRYGAGLSEAIQNAMRVNAENGGKPGLFGVLSTLYNKSGYKMMEIGDSVPALWVGQGLYRYFMAKLRDEAGNTATRSEEEIKKIALARTWAAIEATQQSSRIENLSAAQRGGQLGRLLYQFLSSPVLQLSYEVQVIKEAYSQAKAYGGWANVDPETKKHLYRVLVINHILMPTLLNLATILAGLPLGAIPDKDELIYGLLVSMVIGQYGCIFMAGAIGENTLNALLTGKYNYGAEGLPVTGIADLFTKLGVTAHDLLTLDTEDLQKDFIKLLQSTGAPARQAIKAYRNWGEGKNEKAIKSWTK